MKKRLFQVLDEMNVNDEMNKTATLPCSFTMVEAKSNKLGGIVSMGVEAHILQKIFLGDLRPMLVVLDMKEYNRIEALPVNDELETAIARAEDTTEKIIDLMDFVAEAKGHISDEEIISQVRKSLPVLLETLTPKTEQDELHKEP